MTDRSIADLFNIPGRFVRSVNIERDLRDPQALDGYVVLPTVESALKRICSGLGRESGRRAWRITGDYGTGKSCFGLALVRLLTNSRLRVPPDVMRAAGLQSGRRPALHPLLVTGSREPIGTALMRSLGDAVGELEGGQKAFRSLQRELRAPNGLRDSDILQLVVRFNELIVSTGVGKGTILVIDELGKLLEHAALHPAKSDVFLLQGLAEAGSRSGGSPLVTVCLLHQGFQSYAQQLPALAQQEWAKVAARFEEVVFNQPLEHTAALATKALNLSTLDKRYVAAASKAMAQAQALGWYGVAVRSKELRDDAARLYPIHPTVLPLAVRFFRRFGQNERSLFTFLLSDEPYGLQHFALRSPGPDVWYRISDFYDYIRATFGHLIGGRSSGAQWLRIMEIIDGAADMAENDRTLLKTVGLLNLIDADDLRATSESLSAAAGTDLSATTAGITRLKKTRVLFDRGAGVLCLWPHTSVDLVRAFETASRTLGPVEGVAPLLRARLDPPPLIARRHYVKTGTLRHFNVRYCAAAEFLDTIAAPADSDGLIVLPLCDTHEECDSAHAHAKSESLRGRLDLLVAVPDPLSGLAGLVHDLRCWEWVLHNTPELNHDSYAASEVLRQVDAARRALRKQAGQLVSLDAPIQDLGITWYHAGESIPIPTGRDLLARVSDICDAHYGKSPIVKNELINRRQLSSAAARARTILIDAVLQKADEPSLGLPLDKSPPERAMYLSVLQGSVHRMVDGRHVVAEPEKHSDPCRLRPALRRINGVLTREPDARIPVLRIFDELRRAPFGVRDGLIPLLLAVYAKAHQHELAWYENGGFLRHLGGAEFLRLTKAPDTFEAQLCKVSGVRTEVFNRLIAVLGLQAPLGRAPELLDVVTPLCQFVSQLPPVIQRTSALSAKARAVRDALNSAGEPGPLLFRALPRACQRDPFLPDSPLSNARILDFVDELRAALNELRDAYPTLLERIERFMNEAFDVAGHNGLARAAIADRGRRLLLSVREPRMKAFCLRLADAHLAKEQWIESVASFVREKPPARWTDGDEAEFREGLARLAQAIQRIEAVGFPETVAQGGDALRVVVTRADGSEVDHVVLVNPADEQRVSDLAARVAALLIPGDNLALAAVSRVFWQAIERGRS